MKKILKAKCWLSKIFLFYLLLVVSGEPVFSQPCDDYGLKPVENYKLKYRSRRNRCEGFYTSKVSAGRMDIVGLVKGEFRFKYDKKEIVEVSSPIITNEPIFVRAVGIPIKTYYRMDAQIAPGKKLTWPIGDVIYYGKLSYKKIGVFGWIKKDNNLTYVPVSAKAKMKSVPQKTDIVLYLRASVDSEKIIWRFSDVVDGDCSKLSEWKKSTHRPYYRLGQPIPILLPKSRTGELCVEVSAKERESNRELHKIARIIVGKQ